MNETITPSVESSELKDIIKPIKDELTQLKTSTNNNEILKKFGDKIRVFGNYIDNYNDKTEFNRIISDIESGKNIGAGDWEKINQVLINIESKPLNQQQIIEIRNAIQLSRVQLESLRSTLSQQPVLNEFEKKIQELKTEFDGIKSEIQGYKKQYPFMSGFLIAALPEPLRNYIRQKKIQSQPQSQNGMLNGLMSITGSIQSGLDSIYSNFSGIVLGLSGFLGFGGNMSEIYEKIVNFWEKLPENIKSNIGELDKVVGIESIRQLIQPDQQSPEIQAQGIENVKKGFRESVQYFVEKYFNKKLKPEQINSIIDKMNFEELLKNKKNIEGVIAKWVKGEKVDGNYFDGAIEAIIFPFEIYWRLTNILVEEKIITWWEVLRMIPKSTSENAINYGYNSIMLFGYGSNLVLGQVDSKTFIEKIGELYKKTPDTAKSIIGILIYRSGGPFLNALGSIAEYAGKMITYSLFDNRSFSETFGTITSGLKGNIDGHMKILQDIADSLPPDLGKDIESKVDLLKLTIGSVDENAKLVKVYNEMRNFTGNFGVEFVKKFKDIHGIDLPDSLVEFSRQSTKDAFKGKLIDKISGVGRGLDNLVSEFGAYIGGEFKGMLSTSNVVNSLSKDIQKINTTLADIVRDDTVFGRFKQGVNKIRLAIQGVEMMGTADRVKFNLTKVSNIDEWINNLKILAKESPEILKFIIGKAPIFIVGAIEFQGENISDRIGNLLKGLACLIPIVGPVWLLKDGLDIASPDIGQVGFAAGILGLDGFFVLKALQKGELLKFIARPFIDIAEIAIAIPRTGLHIFKMIKDGGNISLRGSKSSGGLISKLVSGSILKTASIALLIAGGYMLYNELNENDIPENIKQAGTDSQKLQEIVSENWAKLSGEDRAHLIKLALGIKLGLDADNIDKIKVNYDSSKNEYAINYSSIDNTEGGTPYIQVAIDEIQAFINSNKS